MKKIVLISMLLALIPIAKAQNLEELDLDATIHNTVRVPAVAGTKIYDDGGKVGNYSAGKDYWVTFTGSCNAPNVFAFTIEQLEINTGDTLFIYDGPNITSPLLFYATKDDISPSTVNIFASPTNTLQALTLRFKTDNSNSVSNGFCVLTNCKKPCESVVPHLDSIFYKTHNGEIYEFSRIKLLYDYDTVMEWDSQLHDSVMVIHPIPFFGVNLCMGDGVIFTAHCDYSNTTGWYHPTDQTSKFHWDLGTGDSVVGIGATSVHYDQYKNVGCYDVTLSVVDSSNCTAKTFPTVRVRIAKNPLKTLFTLADICNNDSLYVNMGYDGDNATLTLAYIEYKDMQSKTNNIRTFIPDGPNCAVLCYNAPVTFTEFPMGKKVESIEDICSVCVNYEHTYMGDYDLAILCPTYGAPGMPANHGKAVLKYKNSMAGLPDGTSGGGLRPAGLPYGGSFGDGGHDYDHMAGNDCDSLQNPFGIGWNYCFSRNKDYTLCNGQPANTVNPVGAGIASAPTIMVNVTYPPIPAGFTNAGSTASPKSFSTVDSSDHANKLKYLTPADNFSTLVNCPLNGMWNIEICDHLSIDNGWVFSWSLDICGVTTDNCKYQVAIDSIVWEPDPAPQYHDYELGHYRGAEVRRKNPLEAFICTPDTAGKFPINVTIYDEFGCVWDTNTTITSYWAPKPHLGNDTTLCGIATAVLDATDDHTASQNYTYIWSPFGQTTPTITTAEQPNTDITYVVEAMNTLNATRCVSRDTIKVALRNQPLPNFIPEPFTLEGCSPMTIKFNNRSTNGYFHHWDFGDSITSDLESPTHTWKDGVYDLKYYVTSVDGCIDSVIMLKSIAVFPAPKPSFAWNPIYPTIVDPVVKFINNTEPKNSANKYFWEVQYNRDNPLSFTTLVQDDPTYNFSQYADNEDMPGIYTVRLISRTDNLAPSGNIIYCRDTTENTIMLVNDYLQFPNVVTPNGDGVNDKFIIVGLVNGYCYPINTLDIYNKWGTHIFHIENINNEDMFWDPSDVPAGTYFYRFTAKGYKGDIERNGAVEVLK